MLNCFKVRIIGNDDRSTSRMVSNFSEAVYLIYLRPHRRERFFKQTVLHHQFDQSLFELVQFIAQVLNLFAGRLTGGITGEALLAGPQELFRPTIIEVLVDPLPAAQLGNAVLAAKAFQGNPNLFLG